MKIKVSSQELSTALRKCPGGRMALPIMSCVLMEAKDTAKEVLCTATDLEQEIALAIQAEVVSPGAAAIPMEKLLRIASSFPDDVDMMITCLEGRSTVVAGKSRFQMASFQHEEFPKISRRETVLETTMLYVDFRESLGAVEFAAPRSDGRFYLCGVHLSVKNGKITFTATNGHILGMSEVACTPADGSASVIVPKSAVRTLMRLAKDGAEPVTLRFGPNFFEALMPGVRAATLCLDGRYPDVGRLIPEKSSNIATFLRQDMLSAVEQASLCGGGEALSLHFAAGGSTICGRGVHEDETSDIEMPVQYSGAPIDICVATEYLLGILRSMRSDDVEMSMTGSLEGILVESPEGREKYVMMPRRI